MTLVMRRRIFLIKPRVRRFGSCGNLPVSICQGQRSIRGSGRCQRTPDLTTSTRTFGLRRCGSAWSRGRRSADEGRMHQAGGLVEHIFDELESELLEDLL